MFVGGRITSSTMKVTVNRELLTMPQSSAVSPIPTTLSVNDTQIRVTRTPSSRAIANTSSSSFKKETHLSSPFGRQMMTWTFEASYWAWARLTSSSRDVLPAAAIGLGLELLIPRGNDLLKSSRSNDSADIFYMLSAAYCYMWVILQPNKGHSLHRRVTLPRYKGQYTHMRNMHYSTIERWLYYQIMKHTVT